MNAIIFSAVWGVVMMFGGLIAKNKTTVTYLAIAGLLVLTGVNLLHSCGTWVIKVDTHETLHFDSMGLYFNTIAFTATLLYVLLSGKDIERTGIHVAEYYALIFFVLCGDVVGRIFKVLAHVPACLHVPAADVMMFASCNDCCRGC